MECKIKNISLNYEVIGEGKPIVMIHGYSVDHRLMNGCMERVFVNKNNYKRIYIDLPGMGKSQTADCIENADIMLDIIIELIEKIIPNQNFLLAGQSYGGYLSRGIVKKMQSRVEGLLLICPVIIPDSEKRNVPETVVLVQDSDLSEKEIKEIDDGLVVQTKKTYRRYKDEILSGVEISNCKFLEKFRQNGYSFSFDVDNLDEKFDKPSLIILGKQDSCVGYKDAWSILDNFPRATFAVIDMGGHNLQVEQVEVFNSLVNDWIMRTSGNLS
ncbi:alpha/beta fold hydrolase [Clostridium neuense]|uniref:Alpha/beta fold hydrolase n=1 Tax=Clostridium neuense TaxID=1728934 RepID=A0ABW8T9D4_9CLOT